MGIIVVFGLTGLALVHTQIWTVVARGSDLDIGLWEFSLIVFLMWPMVLKSASGELKEAGLDFIRAWRSGKK